MLTCVQKPLVLIVFLESWTMSLYKALEVHFDVSPNLLKFQIYLSFSVMNQLLLVLTSLLQQVAAPRDFFVLVKTITRS